MPLQNPAEFHVASQLGVELDAKLKATLAVHAAHVKVLSVPRGGPTLPPEVRALFATFFPGSPEERSAARPEGWPFGVQWVQLVSAGIDNYPRWLFEVPLVTTARGTAAHPVAEFALASMFYAAKQFSTLWVQDPKQWRLTPLGMLHGATLGIVGFGAIGSALAAKALALGMQVKALRRTPGPLPLAGVEAAGSVGELFATCDHIVLAAPATAETQHMVNAPVLAQAKPGLHLVNVGRGSLIDQDALLAALEAGRMAAVTLDVTEPEPLPAGHPLYAHPRVRISPHTAAISAHTHQALIAKFMRNLDHLQHGRPLEDVVRWQDAVPPPTPDRAP